MTQQIDRSIFASIVAVSVFAACAPQAPVQSKERFYTGHHSSEAVLEFDYAVEINAGGQPSLARAGDLIEAQLTHLFGPMSFGYPRAAPKGNHQVTNIRISPQAIRPGIFLANYHYKGIISVGEGSESTYLITLPRNPVTIYSESILREGTTKSYPCTDSHYFSEGDFWYFWNPNQFDCPLEQGKHYDKIKASLRRIETTVRTYPDYERLVDPQGNLTIALFFGMDDPSKGWDPLASADINADNFRKVRQRLDLMGFQGRQLTETEIKKIAGVRLQAPLPYVEDFTKKTPKAKITARLFFGATGMGEDSTAFYYFFKDALENQSVMIYGGHSGLGGHLDLAAIEQMEGVKIQPNVNRYQIYYFNSCTSYTYYNKAYFDRKTSSRDKDGTLNLDVLTNGLATAFSVMSENSLSLIKAIDSWASGKPKTSYQELAALIDSRNLFGVNGDEDNPVR